MQCVLNEYSLNECGRIVVKIKRAVHQTHMQGLRGSYHLGAWFGSCLTPPYYARQQMSSVLLEGEFLFRGIVWLNHSPSTWHVPPPLIDLPELLLADGEVGTYVSDLLQCLPSPPSPVLPPFHHKLPGTSWTLMSISAHERLPFCGDENVSFLNFLERLCVWLFTSWTSFGLWWELCFCYFYLLYSKVCL